MPEPLHRWRYALTAAVGALALAAAVLGAVLGKREGDERAAPSGDSRAGGGSFLARIVPAPGAPPRGPAGPAARRALERRVAHMFLLGFEGTDPGRAALRRPAGLGPGGLLVGRENFADAGQIEALVAAAGRANAVAPLVLAQQDGGELNSLPGLPPARVAADLGSAGEAAAEARASGRALRGLGLSGVLGPVLDVGLGSGSAVGARAYSDDPGDVAAYARATVRAYAQAGVLTAVRHFPGLGAADQSTEEGPASVGLDLPELRERDLVPFAAAVEAGTPGVVLGHGLYPFSGFTTPASLSRRVSTGLLRNELGFRGVAITDDLADPAITVLYSVPRAAVEAVAAGADMVTISGPPEDQEAAYRAVLRAVREGRIPARRIDEAAARVERARREAG